MSAILLHFCTGQLWSRSWPDHPLSVPWRYWNPFTLTGSVEWTFVTVIMRQSFLNTSVLTSTCSSDDWTPLPIFTITHVFCIIFFCIILCFILYYFRVSGMNIYSNLIGTHCITQSRFSFYKGLMSNTDKSQFLGPSSFLIMELC